MNANETPISQLHHYHGWSQENLAELIDATRPKVKKMLEREKEPNDLQATLLKEVFKRKLSYPQYVSMACRTYRLKLLRESEDV